MRILKLLRMRRCGHAFKIGIYGDNIIHAGWRRLYCLDCGRTLPGPVSEATHKLGPDGAVPR